MSPPPLILDVHTRRGGCPAALVSTSIAGVRQRALGYPPPSIAPSGGVSLPQIPIYWPLLLLPPHTLTGPRRCLRGLAAVAQIKPSNIFVPDKIFGFLREFQIIRFPKAQREGTTLKDEASVTVSDAGPNPVTNEVAVCRGYQVTRYAQFPTNEGHCGVFPIRDTSGRSLTPPQDERLSGAFTAASWRLSWGSEAGMGRGWAALETCSIILK